MKTAPLRIVPYNHSETSKFVIEGHKVNGKRKRLFFPTRAQAELELARLKIIRRAEGDGGASIGTELRVEAARCAKALEPFGKTLTDATNFLIEHLAGLEQAQASLTVSRLIEERLAQLAKAKRSKVHIDDVRQRLERFAATFGGRPSAGITAREVEQWLEDLDLADQSYNNYRSRLFSLFEFAVRRELIGINPIGKIEPKTVRPSDTQVIAPADLQRLLDNASPELLPSLAINYFAGLGTAELLRLDWVNVNIQRAFIEVPALKAKSAQRRIVPIESNLREWLTPYVGWTGKVYPYSKRSFHAQIAELRAKAGVARADNSGRHSYASFWLSRHSDSATLAARLGHTTSKLIFNTYRELVAPEAAEAYWNVRPSNTPSNVVAIA